MFPRQAERQPQGFLEPFARRHTSDIRSPLDGLRRKDWV